MDPFRIGLAIVAAAAAVVLVTKAIPAFVAAIWGVMPAVLLLAVIFWLFRALIQKLIS